jgi:hypothetical protein
MEEFKKSFKNIDEIYLDQDVKVPEILYLANKSENGFEGDLLSDFYKMFPHIAEMKTFDGSLVEPIFISGEHGDGLPDLFQAIRKRIPDEHFTNYENKKKSRIEKYFQFKQMLLDEFVVAKQEEIK